MALPGSVTRPCYSMRLVRPWLRCLRSYAVIPPEVIEPLEKLEPEDRLPMEALHELLRGAIVLTGDEDIGLKAAREIEKGVFGALEYAAGTARTARDAFNVIGRFMRLVNDGLTFSVEIEGEQACVRLISSVALPRAAEAFEVAAFLVAIQHRYEGETPPYEVLFQHPAPSDLSEYRTTFVNGTFVFSAPFTGFRFARAELDRELPSQDKHLHTVVSRHAEQLLADLPKVETVTERVREQLSRELRSGDPSAGRIAKSLAMSRRTLTRKLEAEGTTFTQLLDELRRNLALRYAANTDLLLTEVALLLGFSNAAAFNRAFKRWTGLAPLEYRRAKRG